MRRKAQWRTLGSGSSCASALRGCHGPGARIAPAGVDRFKQRVAELTDRNQGRALGEVIERLALYLRGWRGYFGFCETPSVLRDLDSRIGHQLRSLVWKKWKRGRRRFAELVRRGVSRALAAQTAGSAHSPWRLAKNTLRCPLLTLQLSDHHDSMFHLPLNLPNRRVRTRTHRGVGGVTP